MKNIDLDTLACIVGGLGVPQNPGGAVPGAVVGNFVGDLVCPP